MEVIPPLVAEIETFIITEAMLDDTNVPEASPDAYSSLIIYDEGEFASDRTLNRHVVYRSLQDTNLNHTPSSSPLWWEVAGYTYPEYSGATNYALDDRVIVAADHEMYQSLVPGNMGQPLTDDTKWEFIGASGRWAPFDTVRNTGVTGPSPMVYTLEPGKRANAVGIAGVIADRFKVEVIVAAVVIWTFEKDLSYRLTTGWLSYFTGEFFQRTVSAMFDLPLVSSAKVRVTLERDNGEVTLGALFVNRSVFVGDVEPQPKASARNFSTIDRRNTGEIILRQRRTVPETSQRLHTDPVNIPNLEMLQKMLNAIPAFWSGLDELDESPFFSPLLIVGVYTQFDIMPDTPWTYVDLRLEET